MIVGSLLESMAELKDKLRDRTESQGGEVVLSLKDLTPDELVARVAANVDLVDELLPLLPEDIFNYISGPDFLKACEEKFNETDVDNSGDLDPSELVPIVTEIARRQSYNVSDEQAEQFCKIFDDDGNGVLDRSEFVRLHRFVVLIGTVETASGTDVRKHPAAASEVARRNSVSAAAGALEVGRIKSAEISTTDEGNGGDGAVVSPRLFSGGVDSSNVRDGKSKSFDEAPMVASLQRRTSLKQEYEATAARLQELDSEVNTLMQRFEHSEATFEKKSNEHRLRRTGSWRSDSGGDGNNEAYSAKRLSARSSQQLARANQSKKPQPQGILQNPRQPNSIMKTGARISVTFQADETDELKPANNSRSSSPLSMNEGYSRAVTLDSFAEAAVGTYRRSQDSTVGTNDSGNEQDRRKVKLPTNSEVNRSNKPGMASPLASLFPKEQRREQEVDSWGGYATVAGGGEGDDGEETTIAVVSDDIYQIVHGAPRGSQNRLAVPSRTTSNARAPQQRVPAPRRAAKPIPVRTRSSSRDGSPPRGRAMSRKIGNSNSGPSSSPRTSPKGTPRARTVAQPPLRRDLRGRSEARSASLPPTRKRTQLSTSTFNTATDITGVIADRASISAPRPATIKPVPARPQRTSIRRSLDVSGDVHGGRPSQSAPRPAGPRKANGPKRRPVPKRRKQRSGSS